ncbi:MAG: type II toxin-antitoxin system VapC family toxin [Lentisphaeria bacterium]|nr:type II toxin-antitoxin system VapC family toxin [Lentisphaeria bacterium]
MNAASLFVLDTDILIFLIRGLKKSCASPEHIAKAMGVLRRIQDTQAAGGITGVSAITVAELEFGAAKSASPEKERRAVTRILTPFELFPFSPFSVPRHYGEIRLALEKQGSMIGAMDLLIAAHARSLGAKLVTNNLRDFGRIEGLECENWTIGERK